MNIEELSENGKAQHARNPLPVSKPRTQAPARPARPASLDSVDMSMIGRILAKGLKELAEDEPPRPEKLEQFREFVRRPGRLPDKVVDGILRRMTSG